MSGTREPGPDGVNGGERRDGDGVAVVLEGGGEAGL